MKRKRPNKRSSRKAAVTVEMAVVAPLFLILALGLVEASSLFQTQNVLSEAARDGARLAAMDRMGIVAEGQSTNQKIAQDVRNFLESSGLPADKVDVVVHEVDDRDTPFDLDDPDNEMRLFQLSLEVPYSELNGIGSVPGADSFMLGAHVVFRNGRAAIVQ